MTTTPSINNSKSLTALLEIFERGLPADPRVVAVFQEYFGVNTPDVQIGVDPDDPPELGNTPMVFISTGGRNRTADFNYRIYQVVVWPAFLYKGRTDNRDMTARQAYEAIDRICNLMDTALLRAAQDGGYLILPQPGENDEIIAPMARGFLAYEIHVPAR
jgi:hypothetical protein